MTERSSTEYLDPKPSAVDDKMSQSTQLLINKSDNITISRNESNGSVPELPINGVPVKTQLLPVVYIKNKQPFALNPTPKPVNNSFLLHAPAKASVTTVALSGNQNVILTNRGRSIMVPKQPMSLPPGAKLTGATYVTMLKQVPKPTEFQVNISPEDYQNVNFNENIGIVQNAGKLQGGPKFILASSLPKLQPKIPAIMPKLQDNRRPVTATTNSVPATKFALLPMPVPQKDAVSVTSPTMINFQISDGKILSNIATPVKILSNDRKSESEPEPVSIPEPTVITKEQIEENTVEKNDLSLKSYELSIAEDESFESDNKLVLSSESSSSMESVSSNKPMEEFSCAISEKSPEANKFEEVVKVDTEKKKSEKTDEPIPEPDEKLIKFEPKKPQKNRRKSQFNFRKDFDDMEVTFFNNSSPVFDEEPKGSPDDVKKVEIKTEPICSPTEGEPSEPKIIDPKTILDIKPSDKDAMKLLQWDNNNVGSLPGSDLKFILNEFGIIEYLCDEDCQKIVQKKQKKIKMKEDMERDVQCAVCECYGIRMDFITSDICSLDCQTVAKKMIATSAKRHLEPIDKRANKRKLVKTRSDPDIKDVKEQIERISGNEEDNTSNDASQDKYTYPWECKKKGFSWSKYLMHINAKAAPVKLFKDPFPYNRNSFRVGMKLEGVDPQHPSYFCVLSVVDTIGYRIKLHFDGYSDDYDFWSYADSMNIFPMGWCEKYGHVLRPPPGQSEEEFSWLQYLKETKSTAAPKHLFVNRAGQAICPNGFRIGMKLEAVDRKNTALICVATIRDMMDNRILVHFDGWDDIYDYWADPTSPYIHPVGWCDQYGHDLTAPSDYPTPQTFTWAKYLKETKSVAAPVRAFKQRPACGFKRGMRLECVDKRVPHLIRVATIDNVRGHQIRIQFDGWPDRYSYWLDDDSPDIHPISYCQKTGHPMEPPLTPEDVYDFPECPTVGCRGQGHIGNRFSTHSNTKDCPYADQNIDKERQLKDRLLIPELRPESKEPISRQLQDKAKPRIGRPPKWLRELRASKCDKTEEPPAKIPKHDFPLKPFKQLVDKKPRLPSVVEEKARKLIKESNTLPVELESWKKHSEFLAEYLESTESPLLWTPGDVMEFVSMIPGCESNTHNLDRQDIDGEAFLQLSQSDILNILNFKVGPAVKLYTAIIMLRERYCDKNSLVK